MQKYYTENGQLKMLAENINAFSTEKIVAENIYLFIYFISAEKIYLLRKYLSENINAINAG